jgi:hypothetical protein
MPEARDDLTSLDKPVAQRILDKLRWLAGHTEYPAPHSADRVAATTLGAKFHD